MIMVSDNPFRLTASYARLEDAIGDRIELPTPYIGVDVAYI